MVPVWTETCRSDLWNFNCFNIPWFYNCVHQCGIIKSALIPWMRLFRAFSLVVRQMPGLFSQRRGTVRTLQVSVFSVKLVFVLLLLILLFYGYFILLYVHFILFYVILYYSMYYFILFYVTFVCICVQTTATVYLPNCSWHIYQYQ
jgi:hypothetical protein